MVGERDGAKLGKHLLDFAIEKKATNQTNLYKLLLASRCVCSVLNTLELFYTEYSMVVTNIMHTHFVIRNSLKSGYLDHTNIQQAGPIGVTETSGFPYFAKSSQHIPLTIGMTYQAVIVAFAYFVNPELWNAKLAEQASK